MKYRSLVSGTLGIIFFLIVGLILANFGSDYINRIVISIGIYIILTVSLVLFNGFTGVVSIGHVAFMALGAYTAAILTLSVEAKSTVLPNLPNFLAKIQMPFFPATVIAGLLCTIVALVIGSAFLRLSGNFATVGTLALLIITRDTLLNADQFTRGARTFYGIQPLTNFAWIFFWIVITIFTVWRIKRSAFGRRMLATRYDSVAAKAQGINVLKTHILAFAISAFFTGVGGSLYAHFLLAFSPRTFYLALTFQVVAMWIIGGVASVTGGVIGAIGLTLLSEAGRLLEQGFSLGIIHIPPIYGLSQIILAIVFVLILIYRPKGLFGDREFDPLAWMERLFVKKKGLENNHGETNISKEGG